MASKQILCEICFKENAVGYCQSCGDVGQYCVDIHKTGKMFQTHTVIMHEGVKMHEDGRENPNIIMQDITEERCKQHPTEKAIFLCNIHDSMICGRCLHSEHIPCATEIVDLLHEVGNISCEKVNTMKSLLKEVQNEILLLKDEAEHMKERYKKSADNCMQECMEFGNKIKQRVDELTNGIRDGITEKHNENLTTYSHITKMCDVKTKWCHDKTSKIDDFVDNNMAGHLYLMSRHFEKEVSDARSHLKEIKHKHTLKGFDFKENDVILKCLFEDLEEICEQHEEVTGSDDGSASDVCASTTKIKKTRRELIALLTQVKQESEKKRKILEQELLKAKKGIEESEKTRKGFEQELLKAKQCIEEYEKEIAVFKEHIPHLKDNIKWTQPTGTVEVKYSQDPFGLPVIYLSFTFPDGIQTAHHPSPGSSYKGGTFTGYLSTGTEGELLCRMLKAAFRRGLMFNLGKEGRIVLDGISLYEGSVFNYRNWWDYSKYERTLKAELAVKGITEAIIDQTEELEETFAVDGLSLLEASRSS
ncbi:uncharacterized protein LOC128240879 [Mya arenaria]|uniref:uncharacterized protein LOC128240879 n=1 Tax=Mya arenaria TaxID=6604 RepID=UPI0022E26773|nr:uncharacterized protein LOC128240879 [Mya arenaria]XP_052813817.1 uncharacterized protein LOC128240879 [Mya arenaria]XP_052813818.1 uncharacterized protein LOC128240879 [Mya arenaria]XP_052813819.1 uncharacterized protein LOC128240879 [Mya arenaria]